MVRGLAAPIRSDNQIFDIMKTIVRAICALVGMVAFIVLIGEPADDMALADVIIIKAVSVLALWGVFKAYMCTLSEQERRELDDERV